MDSSSALRTKLLEIKECQVYLVGQDSKEQRGKGAQPDQLDLLDWRYTYPNYVPVFVQSK